MSTGMGLIKEFEIVPMMTVEDPKTYFARVDKLPNNPTSVGIVKKEREIPRIIIRNLSSEYDVTRLVDSTVV